MFELLSYLLPVCFLGYTTYYLFKTRATKNIAEAGQPAPEDKIVLLGHDLSKWNYLGRNECRFVDDDGNVTSRNPIFFFASKNNDKRRSYTITGSNVEYIEKVHGFISTKVKPWAAGEGNIYELINSANGMPSDYLREYMLERYNCEWDTATNWWGTSDKAKYNSANNKQKREREAEAEAKPESNVVTVQFGKQE